MEIYNQTLPENNKGTWSGFDNIDFVLDFNNSSLVCNTIRFEANVQVFSNVTNEDRLIVTEDCSIDNKIGGHAFIQSITTSMQGQGQSMGVVENLVEYPRLVKMKSDAQNVDDDMLNSSKVCELRAPDKSITQTQLLEKIPKIFGSSATILPTSAPSKVDPDFSIKPMMVLNNVTSSNYNLSYDQSGTIRISMILERNSGVLNGSDVDANYGYKLTNCRLSYKTIQNAPSLPVEMHSSMCLKSSLTSAFNNVSSRVPAVSNSVSCSFQEQSNEYDLNGNNTQLMEPPQISNLAYLFNDATNKFITYRLKSRSEMIARGLESLNTYGSNSMQLSKLSANQSYVVGLKWNDYLDLSKTKFNVQVNSSISNVNPYIIYQYFHSMTMIN
tara:strand:+ start:2135 stop:3289 length:1155 start_codon:yes stop_codon:yes gene_type:complete